MKKREKLSEKESNDNMPLEERQSKIENKILSQQKRLDDMTEEKR